MSITAAHSPIAIPPRARPTALAADEALPLVTVIPEPAGDDRSLEDAAAVARVAAGDALALQGLYERYGRLVYSFAYRITGDATLAEECVQDAFIALWRRASDFDPTRAKLTTWLFVVTRNRAVDLARQKARRPEARDDLEPAGTAPDPADLTADADRAQRVAEAMAELPEEQLSVLRLAYFDGLSHAEIAEATGIPLGTVKGRVRLALERLRALSSHYDLESDR